MHKLSMKYFIAGVLCFFLIPFSVADTKPAGNIQSPEIEAGRVSKELIHTFDTKRDEYRKNPEAFFKEVDRLLSPVVAFDQIARYVMGKYTRRTTVAEVEKFEKVFKGSLIRFYGKALLALDDTKLKMEKIEPTSPDIMKRYLAGQISRIPVKMEVGTSSRSVDVFYSMVYQDGHWMLRNITLDGINIAKQFQSQFEDAVSRYGKVEDVIANWSTIMKDNAKKEASRNKG